MPLYASKPGDFVLVVLCVCVYAVHVFLCTAISECRYLNSFIRSLFGTNPTKWEKRGMGQDREQESGNHHHRAFLVSIAHDWGRNQVIFLFAAM